ncbi:MAG: LemA family protein [Candidatus Micrarchaeota archaeon]
MVLELVLIVIVVVLVLILLWAMGTFNRFIVLRNRIDNAFSQIDVQLKRRYDLIPNLVECVKGYAKHEKETLNDVIKARSGLVQGTPDERIAANNMLTGALGRLMVVMEQYPKLMANENFLKLQDELAGTENKIAYVRTAYNDSVLELNNAIMVFPGSVIAGMFGFVQKAFLETPGEQRENVKVKF